MIDEINKFSNEEEYRAYPALHYSQLTSFYRDGIVGLNKKVEITDAMKFGSLVDCMLTRTEDVQEEYGVAPDCMPSPAEKEILEGLCKECWQDSFFDIPKEKVVEAMNLAGYRTSWKEETRYNNLAKYAEYYSWFIKNNEKIIITSEEYNKAVACCNNVLNQPLVKKVLDNENLKVYYQVKLLQPFSGKYEVKSMLDAIVVDEKNGYIIPVDLKTTSDDECLFEKSIIKWQYWLQAFMYTDMLKLSLINSPLIETGRWRVADSFYFVVVNKNEPNTMVYKFDTNNTVRSFYPSWTSIAQQVIRYLDEPERVTPFGMSRTSSTKIANKIITNHPYLFKHDRY